MTNLHISPDLSLPKEAVTQTFAILAKRGVGKTTTASVMAEEMLKRNLHVAIIDPTGAWWGLRSSADGKSDGYPVIVLGGEHGDVPLEATSGAVIADFVIDSGQSVVLDLKLFSKGDKKKFVLGFGDRLFQRNRDPLHLFIDEADDYAPQHPWKGEERMLGVIEDLVRRGRTNGIGVTLICQRSSLLNKDVLSQAEVLVAMRTLFRGDKKAIDAWIEDNGTPEERKVLMESLAKLPIGTAWFWSPGWLEVFKQVRVRQRETFNSSATPKVGERRITPKKRAVVDLEALKTKIAETIEKAKAEDPKELRAQLAAARKENAMLQQRIAENQHEIKKLNEIRAKSEESMQAAVTKAAAQIMKPLLTEAQIKRLEVVAGKVEFASTDLQKKMKTASETIFAYMRNVQKQNAGATAVLPDGTRVAMTEQVIHQPFTVSTRGRGPAPKPRPDRQAEMLRLQTAPVAERRAFMARVAAEDAPDLKAGAYKMLQMLAQRHPLKLTRAQLGTLAGFTPSGGTFGTYFGVLKRAGLVTEASNGDVEITEDGMRRVGTDIPPAPTTTAELQAMWRRNLKKGAGEMLDALIQRYPDAYTREVLGEETGFAHTGGTFGTYLGILRRNGLVEVDGDMVKASDTLFIDGRK